MSTAWSAKPVFINILGRVQYACGGRDIKGKVLPLHLRRPHPYQSMNYNERPNVQLRVISVNNDGAVDLLEILCDVHLL